jgi:predicted dehydrogenase/nucleoside-diphosphate-sugar epimerase
MAEIRAGFIGAGYIADWHAEAVKAVPGVHLAAVCDMTLSAAEALASRWGARAFGSVEEMIASGTVDAVHILTPPNTHKALAVQCLEAGLPVLVEKPVALDTAEMEAMAEAARKAGKVFAAGHNFTGIPSHERLRGMVKAGELGRVSEVRIDWCLPLAPLRSGPYNLWLLREPANLIRELGPHPFAFAVDMFGPLEIGAVDLSHPVDLPGKDRRHQTWRILARAGAVNVTLTLSTVETVDVRRVEVRGSSGLAEMDYAADTLVVRRDNTSDLVINPLRKELSLAGQRARAGLGNALRQARSLNRKSPYALGFIAAAQAFHDAVREGREIDPRFGPALALDVTRAIDAVIETLPPMPAPVVVTGSPKPDVMVIGGTGYIGRNLTRALVAKGHDVRVLSRGRSGPFPDLGDRVETVGVSLGDAEALTEAMKGMSTVYNLARSLEKTWEAALEQDVGTAVRIAESAMAAGVGRLVFTGTIASYDMSRPGTTIRETTPFGETRHRNLYARSKAEGEARLMALHRERGLPLVIARPGIVVGGDGPLQHWGIGRWHGAGAVKLWGDGRNILPFVLVDDVSEGLILMAETEAALGQSFNLVGERMLTGRDYFDAIHQRLGARTRVSSGSLTAMWMADAVKYGLKRYALGKKQAVRASLADWKSRGHLSAFDNGIPKLTLGWKPEADREAFLARAIDGDRLFGL